MLSHIVKATLAATAYLPPDILADDNLSGCGGLLDSRRCIHGVAIEIAVRRHRDIAQVHTYSYLPAVADASRLLFKLPAQFGGRECRQFGTGKFREHGVAEKFDHAPVVSCDSFPRQCLKNLDHAQRAGFVLSGMLTVSSNVGKP